MVQYNQYIDPDTDAIIEKIAEKKKEKTGKRQYSKTDVVLEILQQKAAEYL